LAPARALDDRLHADLAVRLAMPSVGRQELWALQMAEAPQLTDLRRGVAMAGRRLSIRFACKHLVESVLISDDRTKWLRYSRMIQRPAS
jgi:hypothetical protein